MLTDEQKADGWIEHDGGPCPVRAKSSPAIMFSDGYVMPQGQYTASYWADSRWTGKRGPHQRGILPRRIIAYRPENPHD